MFCVVQHHRRVIRTFVFFFVCDRDMVGVIDSAGVGLTASSYVDNINLNIHG